MLKKISAVILILLLFACKEKKAEKTVATEPQKEKEIERPNIDISGLKLYESFDSDASLDENIEIYGDYSTDRFNVEDKSIFLDGVSDYLKISNQDNLNPTEQITLAIWYKPDSYRGMGNNPILWKSIEDGKTTKHQYFISTIGDKYPKIPATIKFGLSIDGKLQVIKTKSNSWSPNQWYSIICTYNGSKLNLYVNGQLAGQRIVSGKIDKTTGDLCVGRMSDKEIFTSGDFDDLRIFDRALTKEEVASLASEK